MTFLSFIWFTWDSIHKKKSEMGVSEDQSEKSKEAYSALSIRFYPLLEL